MSNLPSRPTSRAAELRLAFDRSFATAPSVDTAPKHDLLAIRVNTTAYALRLSEVGGVFTNRRITRVPASSPILLGIASFRGAVMPVYDLHTLLGFAPAASVPWLTTAAAAPIALAFETLEGHLRIAGDSLASQDRGTGTRNHVREFTRTTSDVRAIIDLASVIATVRTAMPPTVS
jgi:chemotaxis signal transduction protein